MKSNWEIQKSKSSYHFDNFKIDPEYDCINKIGQFVGDWSDELNEVIKLAQPVTWRTRSEDGKPNKLIDAEEYDLIAAGANADMVIANFSYNLAPVFKEMCDKIGLSKRTDRIHVQWPGQVFTKHIDKLEKVNPSDPSKVMRIMIQLTDWDQGHFAHYGNYTYSHWRAGEIHTFDWKNVPHSSANAGLTPRVSLLTTGIVTSDTIKFLEQAKIKNEIPIIEYQAWLEYGLLDR